MTSHKKHSIDVIVPSASRNGALNQLLNALAIQNVPVSTDVTVLVGLDGVPAGRKTLNIARHHPLNVQIAEFEKQGTSKTRNDLAQRSSGDQLLFLNDDVVPSPDFLAEHAGAWRENTNDNLVLGKTEWATYHDDTMMDALVRSTRMIFFYEGMEPNLKYGFRYGWSLNLSISRTAFEAAKGFSPELSRAMYEDIELAYRLEKQGHTITYHPEATATHNHRYTWESYLQRETIMGFMAPSLWKTNPACFLEIFMKSLTDLAAEADNAFRTDQQDARRQYDFLKSQLAQPVRSMPDMALIESLYMAHLPIKRRAFRYGLLYAVDNPESSGPDTAGLPDSLFA